jgi:hypothetical protein
VELLSGVLSVVVIVSVDVPDVVTEVGLNDAVAPVGNPLALRFTVPVNPFNAPIVAVYVVDPPGATVCEPGDAEIEKSGAAFTTSVTVAVCVRVPLVPVSVNVELPAGVLPVVVIVSVDVPDVVTEVGLNDAVAPVGSPLALRFTVPVNPFKAPIVAVYVVDPPAVTVRELGDAEIVKSGAALTTSVTVVLCVRVPLVPVSVKVELPAGVLPVVVIVSVDVPDVVTEVGLNDAVAPVGSPLALRFTVPVNPFNAPIVAVYVVDPPAVTVCELGDAEIVKSGAALTTSVTVVLCVRVPLVPVTVNVELPAGVLPVVVIVSVDVPDVVTEAGLNDAVAPVGSPLALRFTVPVNPFNAPIVAVYVVDPPAVTVREFGDAEIEKSGADALTTSVTVVVCVREPLVPVSVNVELPAGVLPVVVIVSVDVPDVVTEVGLNDAVAPVGNPLALRFTVPVNPFNAPIVAV